MADPWRRYGASSELDCSLIQAQYHFYLLVKRVSKNSLSKLKQVLVSSNKPVGEMRYCERKQVN